jgi:hypothetical protein
VHLRLMLSCLLLPDINHYMLHHNRPSVERGRCVGLTTSPPSVSRLSSQCGILNISQPYRPLPCVAGIALLYFFMFWGKRSYGRTKTCNSVQLIFRFCRRTASNHGVSLWSAMSPQNMNVSALGTSCSSPFGGTETGDNSDSKMQQALIECIRHHQQVLL